jgi:hypothetical protein
MLIQSWCTVTLNGVTLLLPSDLLTDELTLPDRNATYQPADYLRAAYKDRRGRALVEHAFSFHMERAFPTGLHARQFGMLHPTQHPIVPGDCVITGAAGGVWKLSRAVLLNYQGTTNANRFRGSYTIRGGQYQQITAPPVPTGTEDPGLPDSSPSPRVTDDGGDQLVDDDSTPISDDPTL